MKISIDLSPNFSKKKRKAAEIKFVIIHYTGMQSEIESIIRLKSKKYKVSSHYIINRKGEVTQLVKDLHIAWHAGKSKWKGFKDLNKDSIGIELVNKGHKFGYQKFTNFQIKSLVKLCKKLKKKYNISRKNFLGHSDIAPLRKIDPGEKFPWQKLSNYNLGNWYQLKNINTNLIKKGTSHFFFSNLHKIGYRYFKIYKRTKTDKTIIEAFQKKYLPNKVTGKIDQKTLQISSFLANIR
tara:strand:+ start:76 stop:789 length:714 start_codon:yes stop_codon:yes gene_type:complete